MAGVMKCSEADWVLFGLLIAIAIILTGVGIWILNREYKEKLKLDYPFVEGDLMCTPGIVTKLVLVGLSTGLAAGGLGLGIGLILSSIYV